MYLSTTSSPYKVSFLGLRLYIRPSTDISLYGRVLKDTFHFSTIKKINNEGNALMKIKKYTITRRIYVSSSVGFLLYLI